MFARAWEDGKITKDEQQLISEVVTFLGMHPEESKGYLKMQEEHKMHHRLKMYTETC